MFTKKREVQDTIGKFNIINKYEMDSSISMLSRSYVPTETSSCMPCTCCVGKQDASEWGKTSLLMQNTHAEASCPNYILHGCMRLLNVRIVHAVDQTSSKINLV
jgi:hypothetical protein